MVKTKKTELLTAAEPLPPGTKAVERTTRERFSAPVTEADQKGELETADDYELDRLDLDAEPDEEEVESRTDRFLRTLREGDSGGVLRIYALRKPDPVGFSFRKPCNSEYTAGDVPYDDSDLSVEAIELTIQRLYGGGRYQIVVRRNGDYAGARTCNIMDPPERKSEESAAQQPLAAAAMPPRSGIDDVRSSISVVKELAEVLTTVRGPLPRQVEAPAPTPVDPIESLKNHFDFFKEISGSGSSSEAGAAGSSGNSARDWLDGISNLFRSAGLGPVINNIVAFSLREAERKRAAEAVANGTGKQEAAAQSPQAEVQPAALVEAPDPPAAADLPGEPTPGSLPSGFSIEMLPPPVRLALEETLGVVVAEIERNENLDDYDSDASVSAINDFITKFPGAFPLFDQFMAQPRAHLVIFLGQLKPEWSTVLELDGAAGFLGELKQLWEEQKKEAIKNENKNENGGHEEAEPPQVRA